MAIIKVGRGMMHKRRLFSMIIGLVMILGVTACSDYRRAIGTEKDKTDELQFVNVSEKLS